MTTTLTIDTDREAITKVVQHYIDGAKSGRGDDMKPAFHKDCLPDLVYDRRFRPWLPLGRVLSWPQFGTRVRWRCKKS